MLHLLKNVSANGYFKATAKERKKKNRLSDWLSSSQLISTAVINFSSE
jgi:hypothetical protein